jgi:hypothetical protein
VPTRPETSPSQWVPTRIKAAGSRWRFFGGFNGFDEVLDSLFGRNMIGT